MTTNETDYIREKVTNEERFDDFSYNVRFKEPKQTESIELKRQISDRVPIQDLCGDSRIYSQDTHFHEKTVPGNFLQHFALSFNCILYIVLYSLFLLYSLYSK